MNKMLELVFEARQFVSSDNQVVKIYGETSKLQCEFLQKLILENNFSESLEIGFAYGMSTLAITEAIVNNGGKHVVIDKFQFSMVNGYGLDLLKQAGYIHKLEFIEEYCYVILPQLLQRGRKFDFAYATFL